MNSVSRSTAGLASLPVTRWRTLDIVVVAILAVAFGVVFWAWDTVWTALQPAFTGLKPAEYVISGTWLLPAIVAPLIVRKPGAALFAELVAAIVSALLGNVWGLDTILSGFVQGAAAELIFAFGLYRSYGIVTAALAAAAAGFAEATHDLPIYYPDYGLGLQLATYAGAIVSGVVIAGVGGWLLVRALRRAGVLESFPADE